MIGSICKKYREDNKLTLRQVADIVDPTIKVGTLSSFEMGRSTNIKHFRTYLMLSCKRNDLWNFLLRIGGEVEEDGE